MNKIKFIEQLAKTQLETSGKKKIHSSQIEMYKLIIDEMDKTDSDVARKAYQKSLNELQSEVRTIETKNTVSFRDGKSHKDREIITPSINEVNSFIRPLIAQFGFSVQVKHCVDQEKNDIVHVYMEVAHIDGHVEKFKSTAEMELPASLCYAAEVSATVSIVEKGLLKQAFGFTVNSEEKGNVSLEDKDILGAQLVGFEINGLTNVSGGSKSNSSSQDDDSSSGHSTEKVTDLQITQVRKKIKNLKLKEAMVQASLNDIFDIKEIESITQKDFKAVMNHIESMGQSKNEKSAGKSKVLEQAR